MRYHITMVMAGKMGVRLLKGEWRLQSFLYAGDLVLCGKLEEDLKVMVGCFVMNVEEI